MRRERRWERCIQHRGGETDDFLAEYLASTERKALLIAGAGFDPRATALFERVALHADRLRTVLIREQRPNPKRGHADSAVANISRIHELVPATSLAAVDVFDIDGAVVGGRKAVRALQNVDFEGVTDVFVDISAMSIGVSFPIIRYLMERRERQGGLRNVHLIVNQDAALDESIVPIPGDVVSAVHGFKGGASLNAKAQAAKLWLPQLAKGRGQALDRIRDEVKPHDTCPILPFPSRRPRLGDELAEHFMTALEQNWSVDPRNVIYAAEDDPLDLYRTVLRIDDIRQDVFAETGGSLLILSPTGSKLLAAGALLAALERDLPVVYLESIGYDFDRGDGLAGPAARTEFIHLWLEGDAYAGTRSPMKGISTP